MLVLFYDQKIQQDDGSDPLDYGESIREFLEMYYLGHNNNNLRAGQSLGQLLLDEEKEIHGRCGYIR